MYSSMTIFVGALALAQLVSAQADLAFTNSSFAGITAGQPATITYSTPNLKSPVQIILRKGDPANLDTIAVLTSEAIDGVYTWTPSLYTTADSDYALQIVQGTQENYSPLFAILAAPASPIASIVPPFNSTLISLATAPTGYVTINGTLCPVKATPTGTGYWAAGGNSTFVSPTLSATTTVASVYATTTDAEIPTSTAEETTQPTSSSGANKARAAGFAFGLAMLGGFGGLL